MAHLFSLRAEKFSPVAARHTRFALVVYIVMNGINISAVSRSRKAKKLRLRGWEIHDTVRVSIVMGNPQARGSWFISMGKSRSISISIKIHQGFHSHGVTPIARWMVYFHGKIPIYIHIHL